MHKAAKVSSTYNAGNQGYVKWVNLESGETVLKLTSIKIYARDDHILLLFQQSLSRHDVDSRHCSSIFKNKAGMNVLRTKIRRGDASIKRAWMEALESVPANILHPKLSLMKNLFKSQGLHLPLSDFSTRLPFYDFIEGDMDDKLLWVLGQDFYSLNLKAINAILRFAGFRTVIKIQDFNLKTWFMQRALQVEPKTQPQQQLFVEYIKQCKTRVGASGLPINVRPNTFHHG